MLPGGAAAQTSLRVGDRILAVNNRDLTNATHEQAVKALIEPTYQILLKIRHDPQPPGLRVRLSLSPASLSPLSLQPLSYRVTAIA